MRCGVGFGTWRPFTLMRPESIGSAPKMPRSSSVRPEPSMPAMPSTSPRCSLNDTSCSRPLMFKPSTSSTTSVLGTCLSRRTNSSTSPNIMSTIAFGLASFISIAPMNSPSRRTTTSSAISLSSDSRCDT